MKEIFEKLHRPINPAGYITEIDGFRFFAIFTVCLLHLNNFFGRSIGYDYYQGVKDINSWSWFINRCGLGVELFFAISGFVIALPFFRHYLEGSKKPSLKQYFYRRLTRLEVPFILSCVIIYLAYAITSQTNILADINHLFASITYTHTLIYGVWPPFNPVIWSLEVEIQFYVLAPWLILFLFSGSGKYSWYIRITILFCFSLILKGFFYNELKQLHLHLSILNHLHYFLVGFTIAYLFLRQKELLYRKYFIWDIVGSICFYLLFNFIWNPNQLYFCIALFLLFLSVFKGYFINWICRRKVLYIIGGMCYTIYLLHYPLFHFTGKLTKKILPFDFYYSNYLIQATLLLPIVFTICCCYYILIEKPCMNKNWPQTLNAKIKRITYFKIKS